MTHKHRLLSQAENLLRSLRSSPKLFQESVKIDRVLLKAKSRLFRRRQLYGAFFPEPVGQYSGLTQRELRQSGTCEPDWL